MFINTERKLPWWVLPLGSFEPEFSSRGLPSSHETHNRENWNILLRHTVACASHVIDHSSGHVGCQLRTLVIVHLIPKVIRWVVIVRTAPLLLFVNVRECDSEARDSEGRNTEARVVEEGRIAAIIHDIKAADTMVVVVVG